MRVEDPGAVLRRQLALVPVGLGCGHLHATVAEDLGQDQPDGTEPEDQRLGRPSLDPLQLRPLGAVEGAADGVGKGDLLEGEIVPDDGKGSELFVLPVSDHVDFRTVLGVAGTHPGEVIPRLDSFDVPSDLDRDGSRLVAVSTRPVSHDPVVSLVDPHVAPADAHAADLCQDLVRAGPGNFDIDELDPPVGGKHQRLHHPLHAAVPSFSARPDPPSRFPIGPLPVARGLDRPRAREDRVGIGEGLGIVPDLLRRLVARIGRDQLRELLALAVVGRSEGIQ